MKKIVISGAGLIGCTLAIAMKRRGHLVELYEKRPDLREQSLQAGRSINLIVTVKGLHTFEKLDLKEKVLSITTPVYGRMMHSTSGGLTYQPYGKMGECNYSISRNELNLLLIEEAKNEGVEIYFNEALSNIDFNNNKADFKSKKNISFDHFFGADGAGSETRKEMAKVMLAMEDRIEDLGVIYKELYMPSDNGKYVIEKKALHIWPRGEHFLMALPNKDGSFTMTLYMPPSMANELRDHEAIEQYFKKFYSDAIDLMPGYKKECLENPEGMLAVLKCNPWYYKDKVCLIGDAAHAIVPFFGQGMNCGLTDVSYLMRKLDECGDNWEKVFEEYFAHQKPNGDAIADMSVQNYLEMSEKVGDAAFLLRKKVEQRLEEDFPGKYKSRYGQVVYTLTPYHTCLANGQKNQKILDQLCNGISKLEQVDWDLAKKLVMDSAQ